MMKRMGIQQKDMSASEVIIRLSDRELVFAQPQVSQVNMMGQNTFQIVGEPEERALSNVDSSPEINDDDIKTVMSQSGVDADTAKKAIESADGDLAQAIMDLSE
jgi:nascent polypeptide-associated complex subunit alpha